MNTTLGHARQEQQLALRCTGCKSSLRCEPSSLVPLFESSIGCPVCGNAMSNDHGIWNALSREREAHYCDFIRQYEDIRRQEGRGEASAEYYLALPFRDLSGKFSKQWHIRARTYRYLVSELLPRLAPPGDPHLKVLDLGAGNGWLSYRLSSLGHHPVAVDLLTNTMDGLGAASRYLPHLPSAFPRFRAELDDLPFEDEQFDCAIFNASFHYAEDYECTLREALRCVRHHGAVMIADTAWYGSELAGQQMISERNAQFRKRFGYEPKNFHHQEFLTDECLQRLECQLGVKWETHAPLYGLRWSLRPVMARLRKQREPSQFRIYIARVKHDNSL